MTMTFEEICFLEECAKREGFTPSLLSTVEILRAMERSGWVVESQNQPFWMITPDGRAALAEESWDE